MNPQTSNPNDHKVVSFHNSTDFDFTPDLGCMYDGRAVNGKSGAPGIQAGETVVLPYHIGMQVATNLAKIAILKTAPHVDPAGTPTGVPLWDTTRLNSLKTSYIKDLYSEDKPLAQSETDKMMAKIEELRKITDQLLKKSEPVVDSQPAEPVIENSVTTSEVTENAVGVGSVPVTYQDKQEVILELEKRGIKHDKRQGKENLEKLLA
jgi:hypothetical protein